MEIFTSACYCTTQYNEELAHIIKKYEKPNYNVREESIFSFCYTDRDTLEKQLVRAYQIFKANSKTLEKFSTLKRYNHRKDQYYFTAKIKDRPYKTYVYHIFITQHQLEITQSREGA